MLVAGRSRWEDKRDNTHATSCAHTRAVRRTQCRCARAALTFLETTRGEGVEGEVAKRLRDRLSDRTECAGNHGTKNMTSIPALILGTRANQLGARTLGFDARDISFPLGRKGTR